MSQPTLGHLFAEAPADIADPVPPASDPDLLTGGDVSSEEEIEPGTGAVIGRGPLKVAVYRDPQGQTHKCSAICPHLHCVVHWNNAEKSWDCPCHGSRFTAYGELVNGPATTGLSKAE